jgi:hypothetical protein
MRIYKYNNYQEYVSKQELTNRIKLDWVYVKPEVISAIAKNKGSNVYNILCHGTRNGAEQKLFKEIYHEAYIIGSEISSTATQFDMTVQHDFSIPRKEWEGKFDIVYSNSFDHSITPELTLQVWASQLNQAGRLYLEYAEAQSEASEHDPLDATEYEIEQLISSNMKLIEKIYGVAKHAGVIFVAEKI